MNPTNLMNEKQAAAFLGVAVRTMQWWRANSKGPAYVKVGRPVRYRMEDLNVYINANKVEPIQ